MTGNVNAHALQHFLCYHSRPQSLRSSWPAAGNERLWEQPFQACAVDVDYVRPDGQNSVISFVISKWLLPELSIPAAARRIVGSGDENAMLPVSQRYFFPRACVTARQG